MKERTSARAPAKSKMGLSLADGRAYVVGVRAFDRAGNQVVGCGGQVGPVRFVLARCGVCQWAPGAG